MTIPTWADLSKSQIDNTKIEAQIDADIAAHNSDPNAHISAGESLNDHKTTDVIDHPAGSILADKASMKEFKTRSNFPSFDKWTITGSVDTNNWPGTRLWSDYSPSNPAQLKNTDNGWPDYITWTKEMIIEVVARVEETTNKLAWFGHGYISGSDVVSGFGFKIINGTIYGYLDKVGTLATVELSSVNLYVVNNYRAHWDPVAEEVNFYVNGVLKGTIDWSAHSGATDGDIFFRLDTTASGESYLYIYELYTSREI